MKIRGFIFIALAVVIPLFWTIPQAAQLSTAAIYSQYLGSVSLILMGIVQLQATRIKGIEWLFGSMDRVYVQHKWLAVVAVAAAYIHGELIDADAGGIGSRFSDLAEDVGEVSMNGLIVLVIMSLMTMIPYKLWKWSHRLIGAFFALGAFHYVYIEKPFSVLEPQGLYIGAFCVIGILSYLYLLLPRMLGINTVRYQVSDVIQHTAATEIIMKPIHRGIRHQAGQFTFINFAPLPLRETHPFTISSAPKESGELTFLIKGLGSYTRRLGRTLEKGATAWVSAPFGHFTLKETDGAQVWVGAGIGITPFMAWAESLTADWSVPTRLYYCVPARDQAIHLEQLEEIAARVPNFEFTLVVSKINRRLSAARIVEEMTGDLRTASVHFCGPVGMREQLLVGLRALGLRSKNFHYEEFEMREGVGVIKFFKRIFARFTSPSSKKAPMAQPVSSGD